METESTKSEISGISATPTTKTMKSMVTTVSVLTEAVTDLQGMMKAAEEERKEVDGARIKREKKAKRERVERDKAIAKAREDERKADKEDRYREEKAREEREKEREATRERIRLEEKKEEVKIRKKEKEERDSEKREAQDRVDELAKRQMDQTDVADKRQTGVEMMMGKLSTFMQTMYTEKIEKEEKDKVEKEKKEQKEEEKEEITREWMTDMQKEKTQVIQCLVDFQNQIVPQKTITGGTSVENMSTLTSTSSSNKQIMVTPRPFIRTPRRQQNQDGITTIVTVEQTTKKRKSNEKIEDRDHEDRSKITALTIGTESQTEQSSYDPKNGDDSKQNHDAQKESEDPQLQ